MRTNGSGSGALRSCSTSSSGATSNGENHELSVTQPKRVVLVDSVFRGANGKLDYRRLKEVAATGAMETATPD